MAPPEMNRMAQMAISRAVSRAMERRELTHLERCKIDIGLARKQHGTCERALRDAGFEDAIDCAKEQGLNLPMV